MTETFLTTLSMDNPSTLLSMDSSAHEDCETARQTVVCRPPDINLPLSVEISPSPFWPNDSSDILEVGLGPHNHESEGLLNLSKVGKKCARRGDSIWGAWFFFNYYFKPALTEKSKNKLTRDGASSCVFEKSDLRLDLFLVQHDIENMYMWIFKERPENALGKMQLRSYMNGHARLGEPQFPFSVEKGFVRSHRMQRKHYRGLSNPQCVHGIEVVRCPNLSNLSEPDLKRWMEVTGRDLNFSIPSDAEAFSSWRNCPNMDFDLDNRTPYNCLKKNSLKNCLNGTGLNLSTKPSNDALELSPCNKRRKDLISLENDDECCLPMSSLFDRNQDLEIQIQDHPPSWSNDFSGVMRHACGPVTAAKTIYEDEKGYLIMVSLPFTDIQRVRVSWRNTVTHGIVKVHCISTARTPYIMRGDRTFKLTDPSPEHCPPGEFVREIALATRIPENAELEAYFVEAAAGLEIMVPKHHVFSEEREVRVFLRPQSGQNESLLI
eukprot:Gb_13174 [translate_table: standard]